MSDMPVGKAPAFMFYAAEFLADANVVMMSNREVGCYIKLICYCWREGSIPADISRLAKLCSEDVSSMSEMWESLKPCFISAQNDHTKLVHPRLLREKIKQETFRNSKSESGKKGAAKRWQKDGAAIKNSAAIKNGSAIFRHMAKHGTASEISKDERTNLVRVVDNSNATTSTSDGGSGSVSGAGVVPPDNSGNIPGAENKGAQKNGTAMISPMAKNSFAFALSNSKTLKPSSSCSNEHNEDCGEGDFSTGEKKNNGADAPDASREKSAGQEKIGESSSLVNGNLFPGEQLGDTVTAPSAGKEGSSDLPPSSASPPVARRKKPAKRVVPELTDSAVAWGAYEDAFFRRYKIKPLRNAKTNSIIRAAITMMGAEVTPKVLEHYLTMNDQFITRATHSIGVFSIQMDSIYVRWQQAQNGVDASMNTPGSKQLVKDTAAALHHNFHLKDYSAGVDGDGKLVD